MKRVLPLLFVSALALAACGDDDGGSASVDAWCDLSRELDSGETPLDDEATMTDPDSAREAFEEFNEILDDASDAAPDEISDDFETLRDGFREFEDAFADADYNFMDLDMSVFEGLEAEMDEASDAIDQFNEEECGIESDGDDTDTTEATGGEGDDDATDDTGFDVGDGTIREQMVEQFVASGFTEEEANCIADNLDIAAGGDASAMMDVFSECGIDLERMAELGESMSGG